MQISKSVLALYDFASKQEYIYRTSKIKEISGASELLAGMYTKFVKILKDSRITLAYKNKDETYCPFDFDTFPNVTVNQEVISVDGQVLYDGGGSLMVLYKDSEIYKKANQIISVMLLKKYPGLQMISSCVEVSGNFSNGQDSDVSRLYRENQKQKNRHPASDLTAVIPMTQIDPMTFMPVTRKFNQNEADNPYPNSEVSLSEDRYIKATAYKKEDFEQIESGLAAVIYIDGNSMGKKLQSLSSKDYNTGVRYLRFFSKEVQKNFVQAPLKAIIDTNKITCRKVIGGGDEITLICHAKDALKILKIYFDCLKDSESVIPEDCNNSFFSLVGSTDKNEKVAALKNSSCAGIAVIHAKAPFIVAYELAEAACENAKKIAHDAPGNYFDFYYCHAGVVMDFKILRKREQKMTGRPYAYYGSGNEKVLDISIFDKFTPILNLAGRSNVKTLGTAAQKGKTDFSFEVERVNAYLAAQLRKKENSDKEPKDYIIKADDLKIIYDMSEFYDLWFSKEEKKRGQKDEVDN